MSSLITEVLIGFFIGIVSAATYSLFQWLWLYFNWLKTKRFFTSSIRGVILEVRYNLMTILNIDPIYFHTDGEDKFMSDAEFTEAIKQKAITRAEYEKIYKMLLTTRDRIEVLRKEALAIPIFTSADFHSIDKFNKILGDFTVWYSWTDDTTSDSEISERFQPRLIAIIEAIEDNPFKLKFIDKFYNKCRNKLFHIRNTLAYLKKNDNKSETELPF